MKFKLYTSAVLAFLSIVLLSCRDRDVLPETFSYEKTSSQTEALKSLQIATAAEQDSTKRPPKKDRQHWISEP